jgi:phospholipase C
MPAAADPIEHVVVLVLENRSFDHMLGACQSVKATIDGIPKGSPPRVNSYGGKSFSQLPGAARVVVDDPRHETPHVLNQIKPDANGVPNAGFVADYATAYPMMNDAGRAEIMKVHDFGTLPALHALAAQFTVCNRWFASVPGPTWANRLFLMSGTSLGRVTMPNGLMDLNFHWYDQMTIFDRLDERSKTWRVYYGDTPLSLLLAHQWGPANVLRHRPLARLFQDAVDTTVPFPDFVLVEPAYLDPGANDDHPSHDVLAGEALIAGVYNALRANETLWGKTLLVVLFDEHGGFYDHVPPPAAVPPDHHQEEYAFDRLGVRVPAILVSPWLGDGVLDDTFDHTSLLRYLIDKWQLGPLGDRAANAGTFSGAFLTRARGDTPAAIAAVPPALSPVAAPVRKPLNDHQAALIALSHALETMTDADPAVVASRSRQVVSGPQSQIDAAVDRFDAFLAQGSAEVFKDG